MPLVSDSIPSLNNGISQQPPPLRERTQGEVQENGYSNVATGLAKRPCTQHKAEIFSTVIPNAFIHTIKRDNANINVLVLADGSPPKVYDGLNGTNRTIHYTENKIHDTSSVTGNGSSITVTHAPLATNLVVAQTVIINNIGSLKADNGKKTLTAVTSTSFSYDSSTTANLTNGTFTKTIPEPTQNYLKLSSGSRANFAATSIADYTYIVNKTVSVAKAATALPATRPFEALVFIKVGSYGTTYSITVDGTTSSFTTTPSMVSAKSISEHATSTALICSKLLGGFSGAATSGTIPTGVNDGNKINTYVKSNTAASPGARPSLLEYGTAANTTDGVYYQIGTYSKQGTWTGSVPTSTGEYSKRTISTNVSTAGTNSTHTVTINDITTPATATEAEVISASVGAVTLNREKGGSVIYVTHPTTDFVLSTGDSRGGIYLEAYKDSTPSFGGLPPKGVSSHSEGFVIKIIGNNEKTQDDYYVKMSKTSGGTWIYKEEVQHGIVNGWDLETMPHRIIRNSDDSFSIQSVPWEDRASGDDATNPFVSILGRTINDIFFHQNRLGMLSNENVIFSEAGRFFSLFQNSVLNLVDTDAIDVAASSNVVNILKYAVPFSESLILFSENSQFILKTQTFLSPLTVSIDITTQYEAALRTKPASAGRFVFFPSNQGSYSGVLEYFVDSTATKTNDATLITSHIPKYIEGDVILMKASSNANMLLLKTDKTGKENILYVYSYSWQAGKKLQTSWSQWIIGSSSDKIINFEFVDRKIILLVQRGSTVNLELLDLGKDEAEGIAAFQTPLHLDRRVKITAMAQVNGFSTSNYSEASLVYVKGGVEKTVAELLAEETLGSTTLDKIKISSTNPIFAGVKYTFKYQFTKLLYRNYLNTVITDGRLQLRFMIINFDASGHFSVVVAPTGAIARDTRTHSMNNTKIGNLQTITNRSNIKAGTFKVPLHSDSGDVTIVITSDHILPCIFQSATWEATHYLRSRRISGNPYRLPQGQ